MYAVLKRIKVSCEKSDCDFNIVDIFTMTGLLALPRLYFFVFLAFWAYFYWLGF